MKFFHVFTVVVISCVLSCNNARIIASESPKEIIRSVYAAENFQLKPSFQHDFTGSDQKVLHEETKILNNSRICAGPEVCPLCWNPVLFSLISNFTYDLPADEIIEDQKSDIEILEKTIIPNNSSSDLVENITYSKPMSHTFCWNFVESQKFAVRTILTAIFPIAIPNSENTVSLGIEAGLGPGEPLEWTDSVLYEGAKKITVAPFKSVEISVNSKWISQELVIPYIANVEFVSPSISSCWICNNNGYICMEASVRGEDILTILQREGFQGKILQILPNSVVASVSGTFIGSYGTETSFVVKDI